MSWVVLSVLAFALATAALAVRRSERGRLQRGLDERARAAETGSARARLQYPHIDPTRCIGCGICVAACPEEGVLDVVHGQALVVHGARCVGHGLCARECPVGAIAVTLGDLTKRRDIPALTEHLEAIGQPGIFLAGEVTGFALIRTAIEHGRSVASEVARRAAAMPRNGSCTGDDGVLDLVVVGAGPAGLSCSLEARRRGLSFVTLDQEGLGGTVAKYPRRKLVMTQPVELPLHGRLSRTTYEKEELVELWQQVATTHALPIRSGRTLSGIERAPEGHFLVHAGGETVAARHVCLALGRRGTPRKLGVPGEELPKVAYSLLDAQSYQGRRLLVVGGGDSAVEAAIGLAEQPGNHVTLSYRKPDFFRIKARNQARLSEHTQRGGLDLVLDSQVTRIHPDAVELTVGHNGSTQSRVLPNDEVFVMAGGVPPFQLLERSGVSFDPALRRDAAPLAEQGTGLLRALAIALTVTLSAMAWVGLHVDYYGLSLEARHEHALHDWLRPSRGAGLALGIAAAALLVGNLVYLVRRAPRLPINFGSLKAWMTAHVATGVLALVCALLHAAMAPRDTVGGHALVGMVVLVATGAVGRYLYAFVPRAANGRELDAEEVRHELGRLSEQWDRGQREFGERVRTAVQELVEQGAWRASLPRRVLGLISGQRALRRRLAALEREGRAQGIPGDQLAETLGLARQAHRGAMAAAHYEDLRGILASWRWLHRWVALLIVILVAAHVVTALLYGGVTGGIAGGGAG